MSWRVITRPDCKWCVRAKALLAVNNLDFTVEDCDTDEKKQTFKDAGHQTFPQIFHGDKHIGGFNELRAYIERGVF
jgi:glutaredoxin 3